MSFLKLAVSGLGGGALNGGPEFGGSVGCVYHGSKSYHGFGVEAPDAGGETAVFVLRPGGAGGPLILVDPAGVEVDLNAARGKGRGRGS